MDISIALKDAIDLALKAIGVVVGAAWVVRNYWLSRTHVPRLQLQLKAEALRHEGRDCLLVTIAVGNPGQSVVEVARKGTALTVQQPVFLADTKPDLEPDWGDPSEPSDIEVFDVLDAVFDFEKDRGTIEPGVTLNEQLLIGLGDATPSIRRLELRIVQVRQLRIRAGRRILSHTAVAVSTPLPKSNGGRQPLRKELRR